MYYVAFCLLVANSFSCSPVLGPKLGLYLVTLQSLCFYNVFKCLLLLLLLLLLSSSSVLAVAVALFPGLHVIRRGRFVMAILLFSFYVSEVR
jgi:hypothetical protein